MSKKPTCIHSMGAVPKPDGGVRPITDCSMPRDISVNNFCENIIEDFQYKSVDNVLAMLQEGDYMAVVDIKSAYRAVPISPGHRRCATSIYVCCIFFISYLILLFITEFVILVFTAY